MAQQPTDNNSSTSRHPPALPPPPPAARIRAAIEPVIPVLNGEIQPAPVLPVDSLILLDVGAPFNTTVVPAPARQRDSIQSQIRAQLRQVLGLGQPHNYVNPLQEIAVNFRPTATTATPANAQQPLVDMLTLSLPVNATDEQTRRLVQLVLEEAEQQDGGRGSLTLGHTSSLLSNLDSHLRTPLLQTLNLSQQELSQSEARLRAIQTAIGTLQQTYSTRTVSASSLLPGTFARPSFNLTVDQGLLGSSLAADREDFIFLADCSFRSHRHEELLAHVRSFLTVLGPRRDLIKDERYFIAVGYKDSIRGVRDAWRKVKKTEVDEKDSFKLLVSSKYRSELEEKMQVVCTEGLLVSSGFLTDTVASMETRLYFSKVKGDLYRYMAEYSTGAKKSEAASTGRSSYEEADRIKNCVTAVHPLRLGLALNFGVFLRDACQDSNHGWRVTKLALDDANRSFQMLAELDSNDYRESNGLLVNLRRNLMRWNTAEIEVNGRSNGANPAPLLLHRTMT